jgi:CBS domain-containing protein
MFGYGLIIAGFVVLLTGGLLDGLWLAFIGWFLLGAARNEAAGTQLEGVLSRLSARQVMREDFRSVTPGTPLQEIVDDLMVGHGERAVIVANDGGVLGIITVNDIRTVPREQWPNVPAQRVMTPRENVLTVDADRPAVKVLMLLGEKGLNQVPVLEDGRMVGLITRREILERVQLAETLRPDGGTEDSPNPGGG